MDGHRDVRLVGGGRHGWIDEGREMTEAVPSATAGERSSHTRFVLRALPGDHAVSDHDGSWSEWGSSAGAPVERS